MLVVLLCLGVAIAGSYWLKALLTGENLNGGAVDQFKYAGAIVSLIQAIGIFLLNGLFKRLASCLTDWENHRTHSSFVNALVLKTFVLQACNYYGALLYSAFVKKHVVGCRPTTDDAMGAGSADQMPERDHGNCIAEMETLMMAIVLVRVAVDVAEIAVPFLRKNIGTHHELSSKNGGGIAYTDKMATSPLTPMPAQADDTVGEMEIPLEIPLSAASNKDASRGASSARLSGAALCEADRESLLNVYLDASGVSDTFDDYCEIVLQFGLVCLFITCKHATLLPFRLSFVSLLPPFAALPWLPLFALFEALIEIRTDAAKLLYLYQRPHPNSVGNIGAWEYFMSVINAMAILTNAGLIAVSSDMADGKPAGTKAEYFVYITLGMTLLNTLTVYLAERNSDWVHEQQERCDFIKEKHIDSVNFEEGSGSCDATAEDVEGHAVRVAAPGDAAARKGLIAEIEQ
jgi:hypothetical protein